MPKQSAFLAELLALLSKLDKLVKIRLLRRTFLLDSGYGYSARSPRNDNSVLFLCKNELFITRNTFQCVIT